MFAPRQPSCGSFHFGRGVYFFGGFQCAPADHCLTAICHHNFSFFFFFFFFNVEFHASFFTSLFSFTLIKMLFSSYLLSVIRLVSSAYLRLLIFLLLVLIQASCDSSSLVFPMMYSSYKLNKQGNNIRLVVLFSQF